MRYNVVIKDVEKYRRYELGSLIVRINGQPIPIREAYDLLKTNRDAVSKQVIKKIENRLAGVINKKVGDIHGPADTECPDGGTNCRNCGDPAYYESCKAAGHCPHCGRAGDGGHGCAPTSVVEANGFELVEAG